MTSSHSKVAFLPIELAKCKHLITLIADGNMLPEFPAPLTMLAKLKTLDLSENALTSLPSTIGNMVSTVHVCMFRVAFYKVDEYKEYIANSATFSRFTC